MDETSYEEIEFKLFSLMIYSKGGLSWSDLAEMPFPQVHDLIDYSHRVSKEEERLANQSINKK